MGRQRQCEISPGSANVVVVVVAVAAAAVGQVGDSVVAVGQVEDSLVGVVVDGVILTRVAGVAA